jgi:hypothetical protein
LKAKLKAAAHKTAISDSTPAPISLESQKHHRKPAPGKQLAESAQKAANYRMNAVFRGTFGMLNRVRGQEDYPIHQTSCYVHVYKTSGQAASPPGMSFFVFPFLSHSFPTWPG